MRPEAPGAAALVTEVVRDPADLESLREGWDELLVATGGSVFAGPDWTLAWLRSFVGPGERPCVVVARQGRRLRLVAPLLGRRERAAGLTLACLRSPSNPHTPRYHWVSDLEPGLALQLALGALAAVPWHRISLEYLDPDDPLPRSAARGGALLGARAREHLTSPWVPIRGSWDEYYKTLSSGFRKNNRSARRKLAEAGRVEFETVREESHLAPALAEAYAVEQSSWKGTAGSAIADHPEQVAFYDEVARRSAARGRFELHLLRVDGRAIAFQYCLPFLDGYNLVKVGYDPAWGRYSPGSLLQLEVLQRVFRAGDHDRFDMLGTASGWKMRWSPSLRQLRILDLYRASAAGRWAYGSEVVLRRVVKRIPGAAGLHALLRGGRSSR